MGVAPRACDGVACPAALNSRRRARFIAMVRLASWCRGFMISELGDRASQLNVRTSDLQSSSPERTGRLPRRAQAARQGALHGPGVAAGVGGLAGEEQGVLDRPRQAARRPGAADARVTVSATGIRGALPVVHPGREA